MRLITTKMRLALAMAGLIGGYGTAQASQVFAPFVDMTAWPTPVLDQVGVQQGIQQFTLAFVVSANGSCQPSWGGVETIAAGGSGDLQTAIGAGVQRYRAKGGEVAVSFGGENGIPLSDACTSASAAQAAYKTVIDAYALTHIDFDIEGASVQNLTGLGYTFQAIAQLQKSASKGLHVSLTLPVLPSGLTADGVNVVNAALRAGVALDTVNGMTMDYGSPVADMGAAANTAAAAIEQQLATAYAAVGQSRSAAQLWGMVGVTPMIGMNDTQGETFTLANASAVLATARGKGVGLLAMWSAGRDAACPGGGAYVSPSCSGIAQTPYQFAGIFSAYADHWGSGVSKDPSYSGGSGSGGSQPPAPGAAWSATQVYNTGDTVSYQGATYQAQWWTQGDVPGQAAVWKQLAGPTPAWSASMAYAGGSCVSYQGATYCAQWWTQGDVPSAGGVWVKK